MFHGNYPGQDPVTARSVPSTLRNPMLGVDFSRAELRHVAFDCGIDLRTCTLPTEGYLRIPRPRAVYMRALAKVRSTWTGAAQTRAVFYLEETLKWVPDEQPIDIIRPMDFVEGPFGRDLGGAVDREFIRLIEEATQEKTMSS